MKAERMNAYVIEARNRIVTVEEKTGIYGASSTRLLNSLEASGNLKSTDFVAIAIELTGVTSELSWCKYAATIYVDKMEFLGKELSIWCQWSKERTAFNTMLKRTESGVTAKVRSLSAFYTALLQKSTYLCSRADSQVQTVS